MKSSSPVLSLSFLSLSAQDSLTILFAGDAMMHQKQLDNTRREIF